MHENLPTDTFAFHRPALRTMFAARKRVFIDLLKWDLPALAGEYEVDQFDTVEARYLILGDRAGDHRASARLLRTDRPHILGELYPFLCAGPVPSGPTTYEITRFCLDPRQRAPERREARNELVTALAVHALSAGITDYTGVATSVWYEQIATFGWRCNRLGLPAEVDGQQLVGLHIRIDAQTCAALRTAGIFRDLTLGLGEELEHTA